MPNFDDAKWTIMRIVGGTIGRRRPPFLRYRVKKLPEGPQTPGVGSERGRSLPSLEFAVHPATCGRILVVYPGLGATIDGESRALTSSHPLRYRRLAEKLQEERVAAVVRLANPGDGYHAGGARAVDRLRRGLDEALRHARALCGTPDPELLLMGFSAGAGAAAALAREYRPKRLLLVAPSEDAGRDRIVAGLRKYSRRLCIVVGDEDEVVTREAGSRFDKISPIARRKEVIYVPGCDHFFSSDEHDRFLEATVMHVFALRNKSRPETDDDSR